MASSAKNFYRPAAWIALACLVVPMFASYYFDDMFSSISYLFENPSLTALGWDAAGYGLYTSGYSVLCVFGGLVIGGILLDKWGVRVSGSMFVGMMVLGAGMVTGAVLHGGAAALRWAYVGTMLFGLGSEIAGTAVTRSIAKWFKGGPMALAMGLQLAIARLGTAFALVLSPRLVQQVPDHVYTLAETSRPALVGMGLMALGLILWAIFVALDARAERSSGAEASDGVAARGFVNGRGPDLSGRDSSEGAYRSEASAPEEKPEMADQVGHDDETFRFKDVLGVLGNKNFWLLGLLCVLFYSSIIAFKKFAGAILVPRFDIPAQAAGWMVSMLPFSTVIFAPLFGMMVDKAGKGTRWMILGAILSLIAHAILAFAPAGVPFWGYLAMVFLGFGYSLVPAALWPSVPKIVPDKVLGTTFALIYWVQNLGLLSFKMIAGNILGAHSADAGGPVAVEIMFFGLCIAALAVAFIFHFTSLRHPELRLDAPNN